MSLTRDQILSVQDRKTVEVKTPEWGEGTSVFIRTLSGAERDELESANSAAAKGAGFTVDARARFCTAFICDKDGTPLFTLEDIDTLTGKSGSALTRIFAAGMKLNAMRERDLKELEKN